MNSELFDAMLDAGFEPPRNAIYGEVTRFQVGAKKNQNGWLTVFLDGKGAVFGDWKSGDKYTWFEKGIVETNSETIQERNAAMQRATDERERRYSIAAIEAQRIYDDALVCDNHAYLNNKQVETCNRLRVANDGRLLVPVYNSDDVIQSLQYIDSDGNKRFLTDGRMKGGCFVVGELERGKKALLSEGLATALTLYSATNLPVIVAFNAGNLKAVYDAFKSDVDLWLAADNDTHGKGYKCALECVAADKIIMPETTGDFNDIGVDATKLLFADLLKPQSNSFISFADMMTTVVKPSWIMKGIISKPSINLLFGESGAGKSLFALDWAYCISSGRSWEFAKVKEKGTVIYIAGEGHMGLAMRMQAICQKYNGKPNNNLHFSTKSFDFYDITEIDEIVRQVDLICENGVNPSIVFIDTMHRNFTGDENSSKDVAIYLKGIETLSKRYDCAIVTVHHSGHGAKDRLRGSSSIKAAHDAEFCVTKDNDNLVTISCTKFKDGQKFEPHQFGIMSVPLEGDCFYDEDDDKQISSVYLDFKGLNKAKKESEMIDRDKKSLDAIRQAIKENGLPLPETTSIKGGGMVAVKIEAAKPHIYAAIKSKNPSRDLDRILESLEKWQVVGRDNGYIWLIE